MAVKKMSGVYVSWPKPDFEYTVKTHKHFRRNFHGAMLYAHYELSAIELKKEVTKFLKTADAKHPLLDRIKDMHENRFTTVGKYMYLLNHGCDIPDDIMLGLMPALEKVINEEEIRQSAYEKELRAFNEKEASNVSTQPVVKNVISIQDRLRDKAREIAGEMEGWIDDFTVDKKLPAKTVEEFLNLYKTADLKSPHMKFIQEIFVRRANEISEALEGKDKDLVEGYSCYTKPELKKCDLFYKNLLKSCEMMQEVAKVERAPRKKKAVSADKLVAKLKFKKEDTSLGIVSMNASNIVGSKEVWCFDTKTRKLTKYVANDIALTLSVKGASIINYNEAKSVSKTLRKPAEQLAAFKKCGKVQLRTFIEDIGTTGISPTGKLNENHIILRIDK